MSDSSITPNDSLPREEKSQTHDTDSSAMTANILSYLPTTLVMILLLCLALLGDHFEWKVPKFSQLTGNQPEEKEAWCADHGVPEDICVACKSDLMPKKELFGWCPIHGVAECVYEHPELTQFKNMPKISTADLQRADRALKLKKRLENNQSCKLHLRRIQFASSDAVEKADIDINLVQRRDITESIRTNGEIKYDPTRLARLSSRVAGTIWSVEKKIGDPVTQGELLALVDAAEVGRAKSALLQAHTQLDLHTKTYQRIIKLKEVVAGRRLQEAEAARIQADVAVKKAIDSLRNLGLFISLEEIQGKSEIELSKKLRFLSIPQKTIEKLKLNTTNSTANLVPLVAPRAGVVVRRNATAGEVIDSSKELFMVVDTKQMWMLLDVPLENSAYVKLGQKVIFKPDGDLKKYQATITWISTEVDRETRTLKVRAELANPDGKLRNESFGAGEIVLREEKNAIVVPTIAIHHEGCCSVIFVQDINFHKKGGYKVYHTRMVRLGATNDGYTELLAGALPDEVIVTKGGGMLLAELLKGNLGAG